MQQIWHRVILTCLSVFILQETDSKSNQGCHTVNIRVQNEQGTEVG